VEKTTPKIERPETARTVPSLVDPAAVGFESELDPVELGFLLVVNDPDALTLEGATVPVGSEAKIDELTSGTQLDEAGTRAV